jgi:Amt family ammonium transporter
MDLHLKRLVTTFVLAVSLSHLSAHAQLPAADPVASGAAVDASPVAINGDPSPPIEPTTAASAAESAQQAPSATAVAVQPASAPTSPQHVPFSQINSGDTAWMMAASALVLLMTVPGLALFYAGMVRKKNILATMA